MNDRSEEYKSGSLSLLGTVSMCTGVIIGAGSFALTAQLADLARKSQSARERSLSSNASSVTGGGAVVMAQV